MGVLMRGTRPASTSVRITEEVISAIGLIRPSHAPTPVVAWVWGSTPTEAESAASALRSGISPLVQGYRVTAVVTAVGCPEQAAERTGLDPDDQLRRWAGYDRVVEFYRVPPGAVR